MKLPRVRIGTLMLLVVIAGLTSAITVQRQRAARREAELRARARADTYEALLRVQSRIEGPHLKLIGQIHKEIDSVAPGK